MTTLWARVHAEKRILGRDLTDAELLRLTMAAFADLEREVAKLESRAKEAVDKSGDALASLRRAGLR